MDSPDGHGPVDDSLKVKQNSATGALPDVPPMAETARNLVRVFAFLPVILGASVLIGWHTRNPLLIQIHPSFVPMQYNTALAFVACGLALWCLSVSVPIWARLLGGAAFVIGCLTLVEYLTGTDLRIDELFMKHYIQVKTPSPGRMAPNTALCFMLTGLAVIVIPSLRAHSRSFLWPSVLGSVVFGLSLVPFTGYLIDLDTAYGWGRWTRMAVHTAFGFMALGTGIFFHSWLREENLADGLPRWLPIPVGIAGLTATVAMWQALKSYERLLGPVIGEKLSTFQNINAAVLVGGLLFSVLLAVAVWLAQVARHRAQVATDANARYIKEIERHEQAVSHLREAENRANAIMGELRTKTEMLERSNKELEQFAYAASHDLQEPLRTIASYMELLEKRYKPQLDSQAEQYIDFVTDASRRMQTLINDLLGYSRVGSRDKPFAPVRTGKLVDTIIAMQQIRNPGAAITRGALPDIMGDEMQIMQAFQNLVVNAVKFHGTDPPRIHIGAAEDDAAWTFWVKDNGIGIDPKNFERIFVIFQRLHTQREYPGTGIGLALVKKVVERHGGKVWVESEPGKGSTFWFTICKGKPDSAEPEKVAP